MMRLFFAALTLTSLLFACKTVSPEAVPTPQRTTLPNGWSLTPAGRSLPLGDFPMNMAVAPNGRFAAVTHVFGAILAYSFYDDKPAVFNPIFLNQP